MASQIPRTPSEHDAVDRAWRRWAWLAIGGSALVSLVLGLIVVPSGEQPGFNPFAIICRAIGIPGYQTRGSNSPAATVTPVSDVAWSSQTRRMLTQAVAQRGAEMVRQSCAACHGEKGISVDPQQFPNLAGQSGEAIFKQLRDFQTGARKSDFMAALAKPLTEAQMADLAAYFASLPPAEFIVAQDAVSPEIRHLAEKGDPARGNAACNSCHAGNRNGPEEAPTLVGQSTPYLEQQLKKFASAERGNDLFERMRAIAHQLTPDEMHRLAVYYSGKPVPR